MALNNLGLGMTITAKDAASASLIAIGKSLGALKKSGEETNQVFDNMSGRMRDISTGQFVRVPALLDKDTWAQAGGQMKVAAIAMTAAGGAIAGGLGYAAKEAAAFGQSIIETGTLVDHAKFSTEEMEKITTQMASKFGGDVKTQVAALYQGISSGATDAASATKLLDAANKLAIGGRTDAATAITGLTKVMNNYGLSTEEAASVSDAFFVAVKGGQTTAGELGANVGAIAASARSAGIGMEELIAVMGTGATLLNNTSEATTGLKAVIQGLQHPTEEATKAAQAMGLQFDQKSIAKYGGFAGFLKEIQQRAGGDVPGALSKLFGSQEASNAMIALMANNGQALNDTMKEMKTRTGLTNKAFEEMSAGAEQQAAVLKGNLQVALIEIGKVLLPTIQAMTAFGSKVLKAFVSLPEPVKKMIVVVASLASGLLLFLGGALSAGLAVAALVAAGKALLITVAALSSALLILGALVAAGALLWAGLREAFEKNVGGIKDFFTDAYTKIKLTWDALGQLFESGSLSGQVLKDLNNGNQGIKQFALQVWLVFNRIKNFFTSLGESFTTTIDGMSDTFGDLRAALTKLGKVFGIAQDGPKEAGAAFDRFGAIGATVGRAVAKIFEVLVKVFTAIVNVVQGVIAGFKFMGPVFTMIGRAVGNLIEAFGEMFAAFGAIGSTGDEQTSMFEILGNVIGGIAGVVGYVASAMIQGISMAVGVVGSQITALIGFVNGAINIFKGLWDIVVGIFTGNWDRVWDGARLVVFGFVQQVISLMTGLLSSIGSIVDSIGKAFGKDLGIKKAMEGSSADILKSLNKGMNAGAGGVGAGAGEAAPVARTLQIQGAPDISSTKQPFVGPQPQGGFGAPVAAPAVGPPAIAALAAPSPSPAAAATPAAAPAPPQPANLQQTIVVKVGEEELARIVARQQSADVARGFGPIQPQT